MRSLQELVRRAAPSTFSGEQARSTVDLLAAAERAASSGIALFTPVVVETGAYAQAGHGSAADWLGAVSGSSAAVAKSRLTAAERASGDRALTEALHDAELSAPQLKVLGETAVVVPGASETLLGLTEKGISHQELNDAATRLRAAALARHSEALRRARVQRARHLRWHQCPEGGIRGEFFCDEVAWAKVAPTLEAATKERWKAAGKGGAPPWRPTASTPSWTCSLARGRRKDRRKGAGSRPLSSSTPPHCAEGAPRATSSAR